MEAQGDEGTVRHRRKFVVLGTALPAASEARHSGHRLAPTGKGLPTRLPRSGLVQRPLSVGKGLSEGSIGPRAKMHQNHNDRCLMDVEEAPHLVGWRES